MRPTKGAELRAAVAVLGAFYAGCQCGDAPPPTRVADQAPLLERNRQRPRPRTPDTHAPDRPRTPQLAEAKVQATIARARTLRANGDVVGASAALRHCAHKQPASVECEGLLGIVLWDLKKYRAEARYYIDFAAAQDDPELGAEFYDELAQQAMRANRYESAAAAYQRVVQRGHATPESYSNLGKALQLLPDRAHEALAALSKARELDPENTSLMRSEATLRAREGELKTAIELFSEVLKRTEGQDPNADADLRRRIQELQRQAGTPAKRERPDRAR